MVTGEAVALPPLEDSGCWQVHFNAQGWAALVPSIPQPHVAPIWATSLLRLSLWTSDGAVFVEKKTTEGVVESVHRLSEVQQRHLCVCMSWVVGSQALVMPRGKVLVTEAPRDLARVFISLRDVQGSGLADTVLQRAEMDQ